MFKELKDGQQSHTIALSSAKEELSAQNNKLQEPVEFMSAKYDAVLEQLRQTKTELLEDLKYIKQLQEKMDQLDRQYRYECLGVKNIPTKPKERKIRLAKYCY